MHICNSEFELYGFELFCEGDGLIGKYDMHKASSYVFHGFVA